MYMFVIDLWVNGLGNLPYGEELMPSARNVLESMRTHMSEDWRQTGRRLNG